MTDAPVTAPAPLLVNSRTAARVLSISERTLWDLTAPRGPIPVVQMGRRARRFSLDDLRAFAESRKVRP